MRSITDKHGEPVLLLGAYGHGNIGDDVFTVCAVDQFKGRQLYINSTDDSLLPEEVKRAVKTIHTTSARGLLRKIRLLWSMRNVVYWGGDLWVLLYGTRAPRKLLYKMLGLNILFRLAGKRIYYVGCGIGALKGYSLWLARLSARLARAIVVREQRSAHLLRMSSVTVLPDLAVCLPYNQSILHVGQGGYPFAIVVSVLWSIPDAKNQFPAMIREIASFIDSLPAEKYTITLLPMQTSDALPCDDLWASRQLAGLITRHSVKIHTDRTLATVVKLLQTSSVVIGARLHANILALLNATPAIGIAYRPKVHSFFAENGLTEWCLGLDELPRLGETFHALVHNYDSVAKKFYAASVSNLEKRQEYARFVDAI